MNIPSRGTLAEESAEPSVAELFARLAGETGTLVRQELELAVAECKQTAIAANRHAQVLAGGAVLALTSAVTLSAAVALALAMYFPLWMSTLAVGLALALSAWGLLYSGRVGMRELANQPTKMASEWQQNKAWARMVVR